MVKAWQFQVVPKLVFGIVESAWTPEEDMVEGILAEYHLQTTYTIPGPKVPKETMYQNAAGTSGGDGGGDGQGDGGGDGDGAGPSGGVNYRLGFKPSSPGNFLVDSETGDMLAQPAIKGDYTATLFALDGGGVEVVVREWSFSVTTAPAFGLVPMWEEQVTMVPATYDVGTTYTVDKPSPTVPTDLFVNAAAGEISFKLVFNDRPHAGDISALDGSGLDGGGGDRDGGDGIFLVDSSSGQILAQPEIVGKYNGDLIAVDGSGAEVVVRTWSFDVKEPEKFTLSKTWDENELDVDSVFNTTVELDNAYEIGGLTTSKNAVFSGASGVVVFALKVNGSAASTAETAIANFPLEGSDLPGKFFTSDTGAMLIKPTVAGQYSVALVAFDSAGQEVVVREWEIHAAANDLKLDDSYGPNGLGCGEGGSRADAVLFDGQFTRSPFPSSDPCVRGGTRIAYLPISALARCG